MADPQVSRAIAIADVDGDGDLDFATGNQWQTSRFYQNDCPRAGTFLGLRLLLPVGDHKTDKTAVITGHERPAVATMPAIGAAATVHLPSGQKLVGQVDGGNGHSGVRRRIALRARQYFLPSRSWVFNSNSDRKGRMHDETLEMKPGWHTVVLAQSGVK